MFRPLLAALVLITLATAARAELTPQAIDQFQHAKWTPQDGAPWGVNDIAQSPDGFLWLATPEGLTRFDGAKFETFAPPGDDPSSAPTAASVLVTRSGEVWVGLGGFGGVAALRHGRLVSMDLPHPSYLVTSLAQDQDGAVWAATTRMVEPLRRFRNGRWESIGQGWGVPTDGVFGNLVVGRDGALWGTIGKTLVVLPRGAARFITTDAQITPAAGLAIDAGGRLWLADADVVRRLPEYLHGETDAAPQPHYPVTGIRRAKLSFAPDGSLWGTTQNDGIFRIASPERDGVVSRYGAAGGLTSDDIRSVFIDREGTAWAGGAGGLNSFVSTGLVKDPVVPLSLQGYRMGFDDHGGVYVATAAKVYWIRPGAAPRPILTLDFETLCAGRDGAVWVSSPGRFQRVVDGKVVRTIPRPGAITASCAEDAAGRLWRIDQFTGLNVYENGRWRGAANLLPTGTPPPWTLMTDRQGRLVLNLENRGIARFEGLRATAWSNEALGVGAVLSSVQDGPSGLFVMGSAGLARLQGSRIQRLTTRRHPWLRGARALSWAPDGSVWILSRAGLVRLKAADLDRAFDQPDQPIAHRARNDLNGLEPGTRSFEGVEAALGGDGRYWFLTGPGLMQVRPEGLTRNALAPPVVIRAIVAEGRTYDAGQSVVLPKGVKNLSIAYSALSLRAPALVRFRYKLDGVDPDWVDPGPRREAIYTNLPPGPHRFRVIAANEDGVWNDTGATLAFAIPKTFVQTRLFMAVCILAVAALVWLLFSLRLRVVAGAIRVRMNERLAERERIARELHDTLLQGVQGLILRFQLVADDLPEKQGDRASLNQALDDADVIVGQARDRVRELRLSPTGGDLETALDKLVQAGSALGAYALERETEGALRTLEPSACDEILQIVREAVSNAARHARASRIRIRTVYKPLSLRVSVIDDGQGIPTDILRDGREGHFGLGGMRERARRIDSRLRIDSAPAEGTSVTLVTPAGVAYESGKLKRLRSWRGKRHG